MKRMILALLCLCAPLHGSETPGDRGGKVFLTVEEALQLAFPECEIERQTVYLTEAQRKRARELAKVDIDKGIVRPYVAKKDGKIVGTAYFDAHRVRTLNEVLMFVIDPDQRIRRIELLSFGEPEEYIPRGKWYAQFVGRKLDDELNLKRGIRSVSGATLTARATTKAARRALSLHRVIDAPATR